MTQELLKELFEYREDGNFYWKVKKTIKTTIGKIAGTNHSKGYRTIRIDKKSYLQHRLIWLFHNGFFPQYEIDHINCIRNDNRIENLREATHKENRANTIKLPGCSSKFKGVYFNKLSKKWARI
jgi:hypothetical protein